MLQAIDYVVGDVNALIGSSFAAQLQPTLIVKAGLKQQSHHNSLSAVALMLRSS
jgi:hypothetical protein